MNNYKVSTKKRINLPGANYSMEFISEKDRNDIILCAKEKYDYIAISFTNSKKNVLDVRKILNANGGENVKIIAKIESAMGIKNLESIVEAADGIMVARGDLSLEIPFIEVPYYQAKMVDLCRAANKPCIVATQMLDSMEANLIPTRAEVTDVFYATKLSADATMLSGETANGLFPIEAINTMSVIDKEGEYIHCNCKENLKFNELAKENGYDAKQVKLANDLFKNTKPENCATPEAKYPYEIIALYDNDNALLKTLSNARLPVAVVFVTDDVTQYNSYGVYFGVHPFLVKNLNEAKKNYESVNKDIVKAYASGNKKVLTVVNNKIVSGNK
jgi:pyruvate kinase